MACVKLSKTLIGLFCDDVPFNRLCDEPDPNLHVSIPTINLPGCPTVVTQAASENQIQHSWIIAALLFVAFSAKNMASNRNLICTPLCYINKIKI